MSALATPVEIANLCLTGHFGKQTISSFTQNTPEAVRCAFAYPIALETVASASDWSFLRERASLAQVTNDRPKEFTYAYDMPSRALKFFYLADAFRPGGKIKDYRIEKGIIYANLADAVGVYVTLEGVAPSSYPIHFKKAIAAEMASIMANSFTRKGSDVEKFIVLAERETARAAEIDAATEHSRYDLDERYVAGDEGVYREPPSTDGSTFWRR